MLRSLHTCSLQTPGVGAQRDWLRSGQGWARQWEKRSEACFCPSVSSFVKWEKGTCERGGKKGNLDKGFLGQVNFREKCVWKLNTQK